MGNKAAAKKGAAKTAAAEKKIQEERLGPKSTLLPPINTEFVGKPGFNARGEPSFPGALNAYRAEQAREAARAEATAQSAAEREAKLKRGEEQRALKKASPSTDAVRKLQKAARAVLTK